MNDPILNAPVEEHLRASIPPGEADRMWRSFKLREQAVPARRASRLKRVAAWTGVGALTLAAAAALLLMFLPGPVPGPLLLAGGHGLPDTLGTRMGPSVFDLDDGSRIVLAPATEAHVLANTDAQLRATLERGSATFDVRPGGPRRWIIEAGDARVEVLGTRFTVTRRGGAVEVHVERGVVAVHHPSRGTSRLTAGQSVTVDDEVTTEAEPRAAAEPNETARQAPSDLHDPADDVVEPSGPTPTPSSRAWRARASRGDFEGAYRLLGSRGLREAAANAEPEELLLLADLARRSGHPRDAMPLYARLVERSPSDVRAPVAAFSLGRLQLERAPGAAADSFAFVRDHRAGSALAEDAMALEVTAAARAGRDARAQRVARDYLVRFPQGRRAESMQRLLER